MSNISGRHISFATIITLMSPSFHNSCLVDLVIETKHRVLCVHASEIILPSFREADVIRVIPCAATSDGDRPQVWKVFYGAFFEQLIFKVKKKKPPGHLS